MRIYMTNNPPQTTWWAIAPQIPGAASEDAPSREEALVRCRRLISVLRGRLENAGLQPVDDPLQVSAMDDATDQVTPFRRDGELAQLFDGERTEQHAERSYPRTRPGLAPAQWPDIEVRRTRLATERLEQLLDARAVPSELR